METTPYNNFSEHEIRIIDEITITLAIAYNDYLKAYEKSSTIMKTYHKLTSSKKKLSKVFMTLLIPNMNLENGMYPEEIHNRLKEISTSLLKESRETFLNSRSTRSKLLKEFENKGIFSSTRGKENIKRELQKNVKRKPKEERVKHEGYTIKYKLTDTVKEYKKILSNPKCVYVINDTLRKYGILEKAYDLIIKQAFYFFKTGDEEMYDFLQTFKAVVPNMDSNMAPDPKKFKERINAIKGKELEKHRKKLVQHLLENPSSCVLLIFSLTKLTSS
jgi:hypothetical protein